MGQLAAVAFLLVTILYGIVVGGQVGRLTDATLVVVGFGIENVEITGHKETSELAILEKLEIARIAGRLRRGRGAGANRELPWIARATVRKFYPNTLSVLVEEREPFALWQRNGEVFVIDQTATEIVKLEESPHASLPFMVGAGANELAAAFLTDISGEPDILSRCARPCWSRAAAGTCILEDGVTIKLPEKNLRAALAQLVKLDAERSSSPAT